MTNEDDRAAVGSIVSITQGCNVLVQPIRGQCDGFTVDWRWVCKLREGRKYFLVGGNFELRPELLLVGWLAGA